MQRLGYSLVLPAVPGSAHAAAAAATAASVLVAARTRRKRFSWRPISFVTASRTTLRFRPPWTASANTVAPSRSLRASTPLSATVHINIEGTVLVAPGALIGQAIDAAGSALISVNRSNCLVSSARFRGPRGQSSGTGIRLYGNSDEGDAVNAVTIDKCRFDTLATAIEIGIVGSGSVGDCTISDVRIHRCGVGILSRGFTNRIYSPFISNVDIGIHQTPDRASGSFQLYGATINNWNAQAVLLERGRDFVIDSLWAERTVEIRARHRPNRGRQDRIGAIRSRERAFHRSPEHPPAQRTDRI